MPTSGGPVRDFRGVIMFSARIINDGSPSKWIMGEPVPCVLYGDDRGLAGLYNALFSPNPPPMGNGTLWTNESRN